MPRSPIRVLLVEDSPIALTILKRILATSPEIEVVGTAHTGSEALKLIPQVQPQVICTDFHMPQMNGLEFTREVMSRYPRPILVISASVQEEDTQKVFELLQAGAVDIFPKPRAGLASNYERTGQELISKIKILSGVTVFTQHRQGAGRVGLQRSGGALSESPTPLASFPNSPVPPLPAAKRPKVVVIGASTGGPQALHKILTSLPSNFPVPVICIQHISKGFLQGLVDWLAMTCQVSVKIAKSGEIPQPATIYFAPEERHLELDAQGRLTYLAAPPVGGHCPSITVTFKSVANFYAKTAVGILLTGMGKDGAEGMQALAQAGGLTIAQDEASCVVFGMPKEAIALGGAEYVLSLEAIAPMLLSRFRTSENA